jgi:hypothetical protein
MQLLFAMQEAAGTTLARIAIAPCNSLLRCKRFSRNGCCQMFLHGAWAMAGGTELREHSTSDSLHRAYTGIGLLMPRGSKPLKSLG